MSHRPGTVRSMPAADDAEAALRRIVAELPVGEERTGQVAMARAIAEAIEAEEHLIVQAGTGTGKSHAYLVPALVSGRHTVVVTATKALQEQLVHRDLPFLARHLGIPVRAALLKGRSNYLCRAAMADAVAAADQGSLLAEATDRTTLTEVVAWSATSSTGDRADLPVAVSNAEWARLSVGVGECPGASKCSYGDVCFAEDARAAAADADVVVVNTHLYGLHLASEGAVLPDHEVVVIDEAHALEDIAADTLGLAVGPGRFENLARACRTIFTADHPAAVGLDAAGARLAVILDGMVGERVDPAAGDLGVALVSCGEAIAQASTAARALDVGGDANTRKERVLQLAMHLGGDVNALGSLPIGSVAWVEGDGLPSIRVAPVDVGEELATRLFRAPTVVLTSATLAVGGSFDTIASRLGLDRADRKWQSIDVGSPFDYETQALLYCAAHLPDPRAAGYEVAMLGELESLVLAAGGRTLALFTSRRAMAAAAEHLRGRVPYQLLVQDELPRPLLQTAFLEDEHSVLLATMGFWQGFDAPGRTCSLVVIDRLPFARPDDPLSEARRAAATRNKQNAFAAVDLPAAAVLLAQGAGRLIRAASDRGVVAVLDRRLAAASYRWTLVRSLPPMRRTKDPAEVRRVLAELDTPVTIDH
ncbi:MAG: ATP-dependent helicase [Acidimicrobiales bacterium]|nr:ATP-dependent helicase [Acidimicrobiales bacterium]